MKKEVPKDGLHTKYHDNGQKKDERYYKNGALDGKWTFWDEDGIKESEINYKNGIIEGKSIKWYKNGHLKSEQLWKDSNPDYNNQTRYYENGNKELERFTTGGYRDYKETLWYEDGQIKQEKSYLDGFPDGKETNWYESGQIKREHNWTRGRSHGKQTYWYKNGQKESEVVWFDNQCYGTTRWHKNGNKKEKEKENYKNSKQVVVPHSIKDRSYSNIKERLDLSQDIELRYVRGSSPNWFSYEDNIAAIDKKIANHQFSSKEEEQILSLMNLQELFRSVFSRDNNVTGDDSYREGTVISSEITYEYLSKIGYPPRWDNPLSLEEIDDQFEFLDSIHNDKEYHGLPLGSVEDLKVQRISENKLKQFYDRFEKLNITFAGYDNRPSTSNKYKIINTWLYTLAEDIVEQWALKNNLDYHDYNSSNQYAPQDCRIDGVNVDVKTTTGIGRQHLKNFYRYKSEEDKAQNINEIIIGISSSTEKDRTPYTSDTSSSHVILGIYDPSIYSQIDLELKHFKLSNNLINACYFQSLESYFNIETDLKAYKERKYDLELINSLTEASLKSYHGSLVDKEEYIIDDGQYQDFSQMIYDGYLSFLPPIIYVLLGFPKRLGSYIESLLPKENHDLIPIIIELSSKKKMQLFPHYFADYLLDKIMNKEQINEKEILPIIFSLIIVCDYQKVHALIYIKNLFKLAKMLPNVRCKWHPNETMKDMSLSIFHNSYLPTVMAKCSHHPKQNTTIYTYSWKTGETLFYGQEDTKNCDLDDCGCLIHQPFGDKWYGRKNCKKYGQYSNNE